MTVRTFARQIYSPKPNLSATTHAKIVRAIVTSEYEMPDAGRVFGISTSHYSGAVDMEMAKAHGVKFVIMKMMNAKVVSNFAEINYRRAMDAGLIVGGYDWLYKAASWYSPGGAAREFAAFIRDHPTHIRPCIDYEWTSPTNPDAGDLDSYSIPFATAYGKRPMVYSAQGYLGEYPIPDKFAEDPFWQARYARGVPLPCNPWAKVGILYHYLQFSQTGNGAYFGFPPDGEKACELNYWWGSYEQLLASLDVPLGGSVPPPPSGDLVTMPIQGMTVTRGRRFGSDVQVVHLKPEAIGAAVVTPATGCRTIDQIPGDAVFNGGDFGSTCVPVGLLKSHGIQYAPQADAEPALGFNPDHTAEIRHDKTSWANAVGLKRYLVRSGVQNPTPSAAWMERHPRTIFGVRADGSTVVMQCKGRDASNAGLDLYECAAVMIEFGCVTAGDGDGGGSTRSRIAGEIFAGTNENRAVADYVSITLKAGGDIPMTPYDCTVVLQTAVRDAPSINGKEVGSRLQPGARFGAIALKVVKPGLEEWLQITPTTWTAAIYPNSIGGPKRFVNYVDTGVVVPPPAEAVIDHIEVVFSDGTRKSFVAE